MCAKASPVKFHQVRSQNKYRVQYFSRKYPCISKLCVSFLSGHNPLMMLTVNKSGFVQIDFTNRNLVHPVQWPLALKSKNDFYSFKLLRTLQAPDVVFENGDFGSCSCGGDHYEGFTFMLFGLGP